jgi:hypothetical protein
MRQKTTYESSCMEIEKLKKGDYPKHNLNDINVNPMTRLATPYLNSFNSMACKTLRTNA